MNIIPILKENKMVSHQSKWFSIATANQVSALEVERINEAIAEVIFNQDMAGLPVYLDIGDQEVNAICEILEIEPTAYESHLCSVVLSIPRTKGWRKILNEFQGAALTWVRAQTPMEVPPTLALLALLSRAAEVMAADTDISGANYYKRLSSLFGCEGEETELGNQYRDRAIVLWSTLQEWLGAWDGERGVSTVPIPKNLNQSSRDFKWAIQMPISQARLRDADRQDLHRMFDQYGLDPISNISVDVMSLYLEDWASSPYSAKNIKNIWKIDNYRETLAAASISELRLWTGRSAVGHGFGIRLLLSASNSLRTGLKFNFNIELRCSAALSVQSVSIDVGSENSYDCDLFSVARGRFRLTDPDLFDTESLISRPLKISTQNSILAGERRPRQVVPMKLDENNQYVEADTLGADGVFGILMMANFPGLDSSKMRSQWESILNEIARPGWSIVSSDDEKVYGLPKGWLFIKDVEVMTARTSVGQIYVAFNALLPQAMPNLALTRGLRIPGQQERWLVSDLPELKASYPSDEKVSICIEDVDGNEIKRYDLSQRAGIVPLRGFDLTEGRYQIFMKLDDGSIVGRKLLTLVSSTSRNVRTELKPRSFGYRLGSTTYPSGMSATIESDWQSVSVLKGFHYVGVDASVVTEVNPPNSPSWNEQFVIESADDVIKRKQVSIMTEDRESCFYTGQHYFEIPEIWYSRSVPRGTILKMRCKTCGVSKIQSAVPVYKWNRKPAEPATRVPEKKIGPLNYKHIPPIPKKVSGKWDVAFEAMCYLRNGKYSDIQMIVSQLIGDEEFNIEGFTHGMQNLGLIDVSLDDNFLPLEWSISPMCAVMTSETKGFVSGFRSLDFLKIIESRIQTVGGVFKQFHNEDLPCSWIFELNNKEDLPRVFEDLHDPISKREVQIVQDVAKTIARGVGTISHLFNVSPKIRIPAYARLKRWDHEQIKWVDTENPMAAGAIQYLGFGNKYSYSEKDIEVDGEVTSGSVRSVKHKCAQVSKKPLVYYDADSKQFFARLGAELPGLFGRALVAASGVAPQKDLKKRVVAYSNVEPQLARLIYSQLSS